MKLNYCIITPRISGMGGAQLYTLRRINYLKDMGYETKIIVSDHLNFLLKDKFIDLPILEAKELGLPVFMLKKKELNQVLVKLFDFLKNITDNLIIESHTLTLSVWAEMLAEKLNCKHIIYPLNERKITCFEFYPVKEYFLWKLKRIEFIGGSNLSLKTVLSEYYDPALDYYTNIGFDLTELPDKTLPEFIDQLDKNSFNIGTLARLSKPYIEQFIKSVKILAGKYLNIKFILIVAGDDPNPVYLKTLRRKYKSDGNISIIFPGYLNPLGKDFFKNLDVYVGMATSAINSISMRCATITVDPLSKKSAGIFGIDTNDTMFSENTNYFPIEEILERILLNKNLIRASREAGYQLFIKEYDYKICMLKFDAYINASDNKKKYWEFPDSYVYSRKQKFVWQLVNSGLYRFLQKVYGLSRTYK